MRLALPSRTRRPQRPSKTPKLLEKHVQRQIVDYLRLIGAEVYVLGTVRRKGDHPGTMQTPGIPDLWAFLPPAKAAAHGERGYLWIEVKAAKGLLSPQQRGFRDGCEASRVNYVTGGLDAVQGWLMDRGWVRDTRTRETKPVQ